MDLETLSLYHTRQNRRDIKPGICYWRPQDGDFKCGTPLTGSIATCSLDECPTPHFSDVSYMAVLPVDIPLPEVHHAHESMRYNNTEQCIDAHLTIQTYIPPKQMYMPEPTQDICAPELPPVVLNLPGHYSKMKLNNDDVMNERMVWENYFQKKK